MHTKGLIYEISFRCLLYPRTFPWRQAKPSPEQAKTNGTENTILEKKSDNANYEQEEFEHAVTRDHTHSIRIQSKSTFMIFVKY